ncbi:hypothetical protein cypCar_00004942, partial [Cyprinus carpio]
LGLCLFITGVTGLVSTDRNNARYTDFSLWGMTNLKTGQYAIVGHYNGTIKEILWSPTERIQWPKGCPPLDNPPCGFSPCKEDHLPVLGIVAVGSGLALIIFGISSFLIYRYVLFYYKFYCNYFNFHINDNMLNTE